MTPVVPDASVAVGWFVDQASVAPARVLAGSLHPLFAPAVPQVELADVLVTRHRRTQSAHAGFPAAAVREWRSGTITCTAAHTLLDSAMAIAQAHLHAVDDCLYLALTWREAATLATSRRRLAALATTLAIPLWSADLPASPSKEAR